MTTPQELEALALRVETLTGPDREVDGLIYRAAFKLPGWCRGPFEFGGIETPNGVVLVPAYTRLFDTAMTLVPEGWKVAFLGEGREAENFGPYVGTWIARLHFITKPILYSLVHGAAPAAALALTAAALRARSKGASHE